MSGNSFPTHSQTTTPPKRHHISQHHHTKGRISACSFVEDTFGPQWGTFMSPLFSDFSFLMSCVQQGYRVSVTKILNLGGSQQLPWQNCLPEASGTVPTSSQMSAGPLHHTKMIRCSLKSLAPLHQGVWFLVLWEVTGTYLFAFVNILVPLWSLTRMKINHNSWPVPEEKPNEFFSLWK